MATFGALPGGAHPQQHHHHGPRVEVHMGGGHAHNHDHDQAPNNPLFELFRSIGMVPPGAHMGDFVSSQEGLDRIISQLMEQTATSNAPGPATQNDIDNLPRKKVDEEMLGAEHKAECSICMDEVNFGEEVTVLPCKHWFHHQCVSAWLTEHDTCPHCRKGITKQHEGQEGNAGQASSNQQATGSRSMPGAFDVAGAGTSQDPFVVPSDSPVANRTQADDATAGNGGISDRIRRGLFGPQQ
jgi:E3 ubiquitin-protein ligase RNF115/126